MIALDATTKATRVTTGTTQTYAHTCTGVERCLLVGATVVNPTGNTVSSVTYNGIALTKIIDVDPQANIQHSLWVLNNPPVGTYNVVVTTSLTITTYVDSACASYTGVDQISPINDFAGSHGNPGTSWGDSVVSTIGGAWLVGWAFGNGVPVLSSGGVVRQTCITGSIRNLFVDSNGGLVPAGTGTLAFTSGNDSWGIVMVALAPSVPPAEYAISGIVTLNETPVEGATVRCIKQSDNTTVTAQTTDESGEYVFEDLEEEELYHLCVEYEDEEGAYYAKSYWDIAPYEVEL